MFSCTWLSYWVASNNTTTKTKKIVYLWVSILHLCDHPDFDEALDCLRKIPSKTSGIEPCNAHNVRFLQFCPLFDKYYDLSNIVYYCKFSFVGTIQDYLIQRSVWLGSQFVTLDIVSRCFENKNNNCCETKFFLKMPFVYYYKSILGYSAAWMSWQQGGQILDL